MKKNKHDHKGTKALKLSIFFTLMLAPFLAVLFKCAYVTFNKNAKDSYSGVNVNEYEEETPTTFQNGQEYIINIQTTNLISTTTTINLDGNITNLYFPNISNADKYAIETSCNNISFQNSGTANMYISFKADSTSLKNVNIKDSNVKFTFTSSSYTGAINEITPFLVYRIYNNDYYLDNAFYYAIDEAMESPYFAWARTSALYTATSGLTNGMGITTQAIPTLIVYWLILTAIYIIIDIVIESFTYLTHCIMNRFD